MPAAERGVYPFHQKAAGTIARFRRASTYLLYPVLKRAHHSLSALGHPKRRGYLADVLQDIRKTGGLQVDYLRWLGERARERCDRTVSNRADITEALGHDNLRAQLA